MTTYNSMDQASAEGAEMKTPRAIPDKNSEIYASGQFYSSGIGLTFSDHQRSWIDPWEAHATDRFVSGYSSTGNSLTNIATSIEPTKFKETRNSNKNSMSKTGVANEHEYLYEDDNNIIFSPDNERTKLNKEVVSVNTPKKFGMWDGVITRCLLNIFGVIMFLRIGWIVGQAGILETILIIFISTFITLLTTLSMSAMCTNGTVLDGGAYYIISRTLGPAIGGSVGILFTLGNMFAISMYLIGFAEALIDDLSSYGITITGNYIMDIRIWSNIMLVIVLILALIGLNIVIKAQIGLFIFICFSIIAFFIGSTYQTEANVLFGIAGWTNGNLKENLFSNYVEYEGIQYNFWTTLAIFFPAVTGIMAGANISGDLKNASKSIPNGTIASIGISTIIYMVMATVVGAVTVRSELIDDLLIMSKICVWDYIIFIGIYAATLSSAIASLVGAPRILMAIANDNIIAIPGISYFAKTDKNGEPRRGYFLSFVVAFGFNCIGELNLIAPLISQFFIIVYLIINFACFVMEISHSPGWRPSFKYFNRYIGLLGAVLCLTIMFLLDVAYALATTCTAFTLYLFISWKDPGVSWGGAFDSRSLFNSYMGVLNLGLNYSKHSIQSIQSTNWRPSFLLIHLNTSHKSSRNAFNNGVTYFVETLRKGHSLIFAAEISIGDFRAIALNKINKFSQFNQSNLQNHHHSGYLPVRTHISSRTHFKGKRVNGFLNKIIASTHRNGVQIALQTTGIGILKPNTMVIAMKNDDDLEMNNKIYVDILRDCLLSGYGIMIACGFNSNKIDWKLNRYSIYNCDNIIDIWWLVDDGGLILLLPYIMCLHTFFIKCRVRINLVTDYNNKSNLQSIHFETNKIKEMIKKFRLPFNDEPRIIKVKNNNIKNNQTLINFENIANCKIKNTIRPNVIKRWLRLSELLIQYSSNSAMIIVTLPIPNKFITPNQYMALLKILSDQKYLPPTIIMRGNGQQTLTWNCE